MCIRYSNRTSTDISNLNDISNNTINNNIVSTNKADNTSNSSSSKVSNKSEELLAQFSTSIYSTDSARQNNLEITSKKLNGTVVKPNETFYFTNTVGPSTAAKGYEEADIYDSNGNKIKGYGGGTVSYTHLQEAPIRYFQKLKKLLGILT